MNAILNVLEEVGEGDGDADMPENEHLSLKRFEWIQSYVKCDTEDVRAKGPPGSNRYLCVSE